MHNNDHCPACSSQDIDSLHFPDFAWTGEFECQACGHIWMDDELSEEDRQVLAEIAVAWELDFKARGTRQTA